VDEAEPGEQEPQVVVDLGRGPDRRARAAGRRELLDRDRRGEAVDRVDVGRGSRSRNCFA
jgi:hypothetical protein